MQVLIAVSNIILICSRCAFILFCITFIQNFSQTAGVEEPFIYLDHDPLANLTSEVWKSLQEPSPAPQGISGVSIYLKVESKSRALEAAGEGCILKEHEISRCEMTTDEGVRGSASISPALAPTSCSAASRGDTL